MTVKYDGCFCSTIIIVLSKQVADYSFKPLLGADTSTINLFTKKHNVIYVTLIFSKIHNIGKIRNYLDQPTAEKLIHAFVTSKIDFCNSLLFGLPKKQLDKLQSILNAAARITTKTSIKPKLNKWSFPYV